MHHREARDAAQYREGEKWLANERIDTGEPEPDRGRDHEPEHSAFPQ